MFPRRIIMIVVFGLIIFSLISAGNSAGFSQGYQMGYIAAGGEAGAAIAPPMYAGYGFFSPIVLLFSFIFKVGFFFLMLMFFGKLFYFLRWRMAGSTGRYGGHQDWEAHKAKWAEWKKQRQAWKNSWSEERSSRANPERENDTIDRSDMI